MVPANQSYYQISTPVGDKRRRLSAAAVSRLSIIPQLEKSFTSCDETPDFEVGCFNLTTVLTPPYSFPSCLRTAVKLLLPRKPSHCKNR